MTVGEKIFYLLKKKGMTQKEFSDKTGIATTTISDWKKKNTNPGSDKIMTICAALDIKPEILLSGVQEDSVRGSKVDYMILAKDSEERNLIEIYNSMNTLDKTHLMEYAKSLARKTKSFKGEKDSLTKITEFCDIEIYMDSEFEGNPTVTINYLDDDVQGSIDLLENQISGNFSKYVKKVIEAWYAEFKSYLLKMWYTQKIEMLPDWE